MTSENNSKPVMWSLHSSYKKFSLIRALVDVTRKTKYCISCSKTATQELIFTVEGATIIEKYCDSCAKKNII